MDIGSLLQDAPSRGRTERERQQKSLQNSTSTPSAVANKPIASINDSQSDPRPRSSSFALNAHLPPHPPHPSSAAGLRDSPKLNPANPTSSPSGSAASASYYLATHAEMERVRQLPVIPPPALGLGYHHDVPSQQQQQNSNNEQATTGATSNVNASANANAPAAAAPVVPATTAINSAAANPAASASASDTHGAQPPSQNHYLHRNNHSLSSSAAGDVFPPFAASTRHQPRDPQPPQPTPTTPGTATATTTTMTRDGQGAPRHAHHASLSHASHHQFNPRSGDPPPAQTTRPGSARDGYGQQQQTMKQQQQHSDRRNRRDSVGSGYPTMMQMQTMQTVSPLVYNMRPSFAWTSYSYLGRITLDRLPAQRLQRARARPPLVQVYPALEYEHEHAHPRPGTKATAPATSCTE